MVVLLDCKNEGLGFEFNQFSFLVGKSHFLKHIFDFDFSTELFYFGLYHYFLFIYFIFYILFALQYFIYFNSADTNQRNLVALLSESLDSASESVFPRQRTNSPCTLSTAM